MLFNSLAFVVFALCFFTAWPLAKRKQTIRFLFIIIASCIFYGWWSWWYLLLLFSTATVDFFAGLAIERYPARKREFLTASILANLATLILFKYSVFLINAVLSMLPVEGAETGISPLPLPVGLSFYTFQSMSYTIDIYRGHFKPTRNILHFWSSICLFPHLVAGPIVRASDLMPQLLGVPHTTEASRWDGFRLIVHGYFKKMVIADNLAPLVNLAFGSSVLVKSSAYWWLVVSMFAFQIYYDFSGYTDVARGLAKLMGYEFTLNFRHPYFATSFRDFWGRWHISLSSWFRDYVYLPLGGSRQGTWRSHRNMWTTMVLSGLWHGADWKFIVWGALHALYLSVERVTTWPTRLARLPGGRFLVGVALLTQVWVAWVFFRAESVAQALRIVKTMFLFAGGPMPVPIHFVVFLALGCAYELLAARGWSRWRRAGDWYAGLERPALALMIAACLFLRGAGNAFIYFQF